MKTIVSTCRNHECPNNRAGDCCLESINLKPYGPHLDRLICIEAPRSKEDDKEVVMRDGAAVREGGTDPSSR